MSGATLVWLRLDLRLDDNPALLFAARRKQPIVPVHIYAPEEEAPWEPGAASRWWLHHSLSRFDEKLRSLGSKLVFRRGDSLETLLALAKQTGADAVAWNRRYEPALRSRDARVEKALVREGIEVVTFNSALFFEPEAIRTREGKPFQVYTAFWKRCLSELEPPEPEPAPRSLTPPSRFPRSLSLEAFDLLPKIPWDAGLARAWQPGEAGAARRVRAFFSHGIENYTRARDYPAEGSTSRLSPHLHFGEISPRRLWHKARDMPRASHFLKELGWREFSYHLLFHYPETPARPLREKFEKFRWRRPGAELEAWRKGRTGFPIVDAGMRELWRTGWMHNRVRMIVGSFLVKDLGIDWREGEKWFWDTLVDADLANNTMNWQWVAGCGADAAPFFRIFNPVMQSEKFDPKGSYIRENVDELEPIGSPYVHRPWDSKRPLPEYPDRIVDHPEARLRALEAYAELKRKA